MSWRLPILSDNDLISVQKPAQYLGGELNSIYKDECSVDLHFALCFPDAYEVGMSHIGLQILYELINGDPQTWAERAFMPFPDMEEVLKKRNVALCSLEGRRPLKDFDIVGFSLQYELCGTNLVAMLDLGGIAPLAAHRAADAPIVIGGGPYSYHPEALSPFFDAFFLGDAEEAIFEIMAAVRAHKSSPGASRAELLQTLSRIEGVYLPSLYAVVSDERGALQSIKPRNGAPEVVTRRLLPTMAGAPYTKKPLVPNVQTVHNRLSIEVMRGCVRGCRFCQAGYLYRPQRERSPEEILQIVDDVLPETGFEELSLLSLSTADYCSVVPLLKALMDRYGEGDKLAISFPSTRVDALTPEVLEQVQRVRRTGFTVAPEAGTQRLRDVINKGVSDEQILQTCENVFTMGWTGIKLYFMLGLPTETDEDLQGIIEIAKKIKALPSGKGKDITVSVSTHVPKPHTPFQWAAQITPEETLRRQRYLAEGLRKIRVNFRYHDSFSTFLEGVFCRGGRELAPVIVRAYELGCRLDGWTEHLSQERWMQAFVDCNIDPYYYLRERRADEVLPWDHLSCGITKSYFAKEYKRALRDHVTPDCLKTSCSICGACDYDVKRNVLWPRHETEQSFASDGSREKICESAVPASRLRVRYSKKGLYRFVGHLELTQVFHRAGRRAGLPLAYTLGFHPLPKFSFGPPMQLGIESEEEHVDVFLTAPFPAQLFIEFFNQALPDGLRITAAKEIALKAPSIQESVVAQRFRVTFLTPPGAPMDRLLDDANTELLSAALAREVVRGGGKGQKKERRFILRDYISDLVFACTPKAAGIFEFTLRTAKEASPKPVEVIAALSGLSIGDCRIEKTKSFFRESALETAASQLQTRDPSSRSSLPLGNVDNRPPG